MTITLKLTEAQAEALDRALYLFDQSYYGVDLDELEGTGVPEALAEAEKIQAMLEDKVWEEKEVARLVSENPGVSKTHIRKVVQQHMKDHS